MFVKLFCFLGFPYRWSRIVFAFLWLISLRIRVASGSIQVVTNRKISPDFYGWVMFPCVCVCVFVCVLSHIFFTRSFNDGHLDCFRVLAIVNNAVVNIGLKLFFQSTVFIFFGKIRRRGIAACDGILFLIFWGISIPFSTVAAPVHMPTNSAQALPFCYILASTSIVFLIEPFWQVWNAISLCVFF